jgi:undecaprenyl-diphosphatase
MNFFGLDKLAEALILGLIQGLTEFLPISSSAHLRIAGLFLPSGEDPGATFTAITQIGTELAVLLYFSGDIVRIIRVWWASVFARSGATFTRLTADERADARLGWYIIVGTIPIAVLGLIFQDDIRSTFRSLWVVGTVLVVFGVILWVADLAGQKLRDIRSMGTSHGLILGFAQALALIPGVSRSGATISMGLALGYTRQAAARFAFLLAIPAVLASGLYELVHAISEPSNNFSGIETAAATVVAFGVGWAVIAFLMRYLEKRSFLPFIIWRIAVGGALLIALSNGFITDSV